MISDASKSYHIFMFPFKWDVKGKKEMLESSFDEKVIISTFLNNLDEKWHYEKFNIKNDYDYNKKVYFYDYVRDAMFNNYEKSKKDFLEQTIFNFDYEFDNGTYKIYIKKEIVDDKGEKSIKIIDYELDIESVKLKIYDTGIGILSYHLINKKYEEPTDILQINDFGRRIYPQFLPLKAAKNSFLANSIKINFNNSKSTQSTILEDFPEIINRDYRLSKTIMDFFGSKFKTDKSELENEEILITPIIDDRMFVLCWYGENRKFANDVKYGINIICDTKRDNHPFKNNEFWHEFIFVDVNGCTCQSDIMLESLLVEHTYDRWINYSTIFGVSRYSFVLLTKDIKENPFASTLCEHMRSMYFEMVCLCLVQRASILRFSDETTHIAYLEDDKLPDKVRCLHRHYIEFINKIHFREITAQEQGIEIYNMMSHIMSIEKEIKNLDDEIDELHRYATLIESKKSMEESSKIQIKVNILTIVAIPLSIISIVLCFLSSDIGFKKVGWWPAYNFIEWATLWVICPIAVISLILFVVFKTGKGKNK